MAREVVTLTARTRETVTLTARSRITVSGDWPEFTQQPSVILVLLDDVGIDQLNMYDSVNQWDTVGSDTAHYPATPFLDALAVKGITYDYAYASPICSPTRAQIMTGRYPHIHAQHEGTGIGKVINVGDTVIMDPDQHPLPKVMDAVVQETTSSHIGKFHLTGGYALHQDYPVSQYGYNEYHGLMWNVGTSAGGYYTYDKTDDPGTGASTAEETGTFLSTDEYSDAKRFVLSRSGPFFLQWGFHSIHSFIDTVGDGDGPGDINLTTTFTELEQNAGSAHNNWRRAISHLEAVDVLLTKLAEKVDDAGFTDKVIWIVLGDNGTAFRLLTPSPDAFFGHVQEPHTGYNANHAKGTCYEQGVRVPLIIGGDGAFPTIAKNTRSNQLIDVVDLYPTILDIITPKWRQYLDGLGMLDHIDGVSIEPTFYGNKTIRRYTFPTRMEPNGSQVTGETYSDRCCHKRGEDWIDDDDDHTGHWKLKREVTDGVGSGYELYQIGPGASYDDPTAYAADPLETTNLYSKTVPGDGFDINVWEEYWRLWTWYQGQIDPLLIAEYTELGGIASANPPVPVVPAVKADRVVWGSLLWKLTGTGTFEPAALAMSNSGAQCVIQATDFGGVGTCTDRCYNTSNTNPPTHYAEDTTNIGITTYSRSYASGARSADALATMVFQDDQNAGGELARVRVYNSGSTAAEWEWTDTRYVSTTHASFLQTTDDGTKVVALINTPTMYAVTWDIASSTPTSNVTVGFLSAPQAMGISADGTRVAGATATFFAIAVGSTGVPLYQVLTSTMPYPSAAPLSFSSDGAKLFYGYHGGTVLMTEGAGTYAITWNYSVGGSFVKCERARITRDGLRGFAVFRDMTGSVDFWVVMCLDLVGQVEEFRRIVQTTDNNEFIDLVCSDDGNEMVALFDGGTSGAADRLLIYRYATGVWQETENLYTLPKPPTTSYGPSDEALVDISPSGDKLFVATDDLVSARDAYLIQITP